MGFTFKQVFGLVIFKKSYFELLQANSKASYDSLKAENEELKKIISQRPEYVGDDKLLNRIETLQNMLKESREKVKLQESQLKLNAITIKSDNYLIRDLWKSLKTSKAFNKFSKNSLKACEEELKDCSKKSKIVQASLTSIVERVKEKKIIKEPTEVPKRDFISIYA